MNNLKKIRTVAGLTQEQLAEKIGCRKQYISDLEREVRPLGSVKWETLDKICKVLNCSVYDLQSIDYIFNIKNTKEKNKMTKLTIKTFHSNATVFGNDIWHDVRYDGDTLQMYGDDTIFDNEAEALEEYKNDLLEELKEVFPDAENIDDIVDTIMIYASDCISVMWDK